MELFLQFIAIPIAVIAAAIFSYWFGKIDLPGALAGALLACIIWMGAGTRSLFGLFLFFALGTLASSWKKDLKSKYKLEQENDGRRGISNVLANGGIAGMLALIALLTPEYKDIADFMITASFATACSDTFSSEFGNVYGRKYFDIISLKRAKRGTDGAISMEGLLSGIIGSALIAFGTLLFRNDVASIAILIFAGLAGNLADSILGASLQRKGYLDNHLVNFFATLSGAILSGLAYLVLL